MTKVEKGKELIKICFSIFIRYNYNWCNVLLKAIPSRYNKISFPILSHCMQTHYPLSIYKCFECRGCVL